MARPPADEQVAFLRHLQRLLDEGQFVATYKYALLLALAELCVETGDDSGSELGISLSAIADKFLAMYWSHTLPYPVPGSGSDTPLSQNLGRNIAVLREIGAFRSRIDSLAQARRHPDWTRLREATTRIVREMPLMRLQTLRGGELIFLYRNQIDEDAIRLLPGVAFHFRQFHGLVQHVVRGAWVRHIRSNPRNDTLLGQTADLEEFLFGSGRAQYPHLKEALRELQAGKCFYCGKSLGRDFQLDHFISWSRYPSDLGHNFVLADRRCNSEKSDLLADQLFLAAWQERNRTRERDLATVFERSAVSNDRVASERIAKWAYARAELSGAVFWRPGLAGNEVG